MLLGFTGFYLVSAAAEEPDGDGEGGDEGGGVDGHDDRVARQCALGDAVAVGRERHLIGPFPTTIEETTSTPTLKAETRGDLLLVENKKKNQEEEADWLRPAPLIPHPVPFSQGHAIQFPFMSHRIVHQCAARNR